MSFPAGATTITLTGTFPAPVGGTARAGHIVFTPSATLVDSTQKAIYSGGGSVALDNTGHFSVALLCTDDTDVQPTGWRWRVDEQPAGGPRRTYWIDLPHTLGSTVDLSTLANVDAPDGSGSSSPAATPTGPAGGALGGSYPNPVLSPATIASFDPAGAASTAQAAAAADASAKVAAHTSASDPHGDRAAAASALAVHEADTTGVHGIADTAALETTSGAQAKADAAQTAATTAAASDATSKVAAHTGANDPHGDRAYTNSSLAAKANLTGATFTGAVTVNGADLSILGTGKGYRLRRGGSSLDLESGGADLLVSNWSNGDFTGTQRAYLRLSADAQNIQIAGKVEFVDALYGTVKHTLNPSTGATITGTAQINGGPGTVDPALPAGYGNSAAPTGVTLGSTYPSDDVNGGTDGTSRLLLYSYQRANVNSFGEVVRVFNMRKDAKSMLAWYMPSNAFAADRTPNSGNWKPVTWIGSHWEANSHAGNHKHWEIEIPDSTGALQGRFEILFGNQADDTIGLDKTNTITNLTDFTVRCHGSTPGGADIQQALRLSASAGFEKPIEFSNDVDGVGKRWKIRATSETESGSNAGTNLQVVRYDDTGTLVDMPFQVNRASGQVTVGGTAGTSAGLAVNRNATGAALSVTSLAASGSGILTTLTDSVSSAVQAIVSGDTTARAKMFADGKWEWGSGTATRDTNLYRSGAGVLKTDGSLSVVQNIRVNTTSVGSGVGVIGIADATTDPTGTPTGGGVLHSKSGLPWWKASDGVDYDLAHGQYPLTIVRKTADETVTSSTTVQDDDQLAAAVAANSTYLVEGFLIYDGDTAGDFRLTFTGPTGAAMDWTPNGLATSQATGVGSMKLDRLPLGTEETLGASGAGVKAIALPRGILTTSSTAGNLLLRWAQATSSATATTVFANSYLRLTKIA